MKKDKKRYFLKENNCLKELTKGEYKEYKLTVNQSFLFWKIEKKDNSEILVIEDK